MREKFEVIDPKVRWYGREFYYSDAYIPQRANDNEEEEGDYIPANDNELDIKISHRLNYERDDCN